MRASAAASAMARSAGAAAAALLGALLLGAAAAAGADPALEEAPSDEDGWSLNGRPGEIWPPGALPDMGNDAATRAPGIRGMDTLPFFAMLGGAAAVGAAICACLMCSGLLRPSGGDGDRMAVPAEDEDITPQSAGEAGSVDDELAETRV
eukprot:TRINITY_DN26574_c0_g1_i1.p3 TRINITY_DN26574_c0_g1~~TRINITY_DN26574_c0_g1_i1.p3  ORF type:complete len:150 (+),score=38.57 TRINITY_DN26574_c0_g1_i1:49-498(+)